MELEDIVEDLGHEVVGLASSVEAALETLQDSRAASGRGDHRCQSRRDACDPVVAELRHRDVPTVLASGYSASELSGMGFDGPMVSKPYTWRDIRRALVTCIENGRDRG
jgi:hypothetical protein